MKNNGQQTNNKYNIKMGIVYFGVLFLGLACLLKILHLVIFQRSLYQGTAAECLDMTKEGWEKNPLSQDSSCNCYIIENNLKPVRGEIFDDKGRVLVSNYAVFDITIDGRIFKKKDTLYTKDEAKLNQLINTLSSNFYNHFKERFQNRDEHYYRKKIAKALKEGKNSLILQSNLDNDRQWITSEDTAFIATLPLLCKKTRYSGLNYSTRTVRINPYGEMAKRALGVYTEERKYGLEKTMNEELAGIEGTRKYMYLNKARIPLDDRIEPTDGYNLHTTLNLEIQNIVHNELQRKLIEQNAEWGCAVVMETKTGEIKAISNLRRANKEGTEYREGMEYALHAMVEPGSTFKLASLLAYLDNVKDDNGKKYPMLAHTFVRSNRAGGKEISYPKVDEYGKKEDSGFPIDIFQRSSNVGISSMIFDVFSINNFDKYLNKIDSLFITTSFVTQLGKIQAPNIKRKAIDFHTYYNTCFGAGFTMTPIQTLVYYNAVANNGKMIAPLFVKYKSDTHDTLTVYEAEVIKDKICKQSTIDRAKKYLEAVITGEHGTGRRYQDPNFSFAGKTGTRDIWDEELKKYNYHKNSVSFCGYFPAKDPQYTAIVFMYNVPKKSSIAVEVFSKIGKNIMNIVNYKALQTIDKSKGKRLPTIRGVESEQLALIMKSFGIPYNNDQKAGPYVCTGISHDNKIFYKSTKFKEGDKIPNVENLIASDAISELNKAGFKVTIVGKGIVKKEEIDMNTHTATLYLEPN